MFKAKAKAGWGRAATMLATAWLGAAMAASQGAPAPVRPHPGHRAAHARTALPAASLVPAAAPVPEPQVQAPAQPETPKWPANQTPSPATVTWDSQGLHIVAANASLTRILDEVSTETGAKVEGIATDERVFGEYGPGQARDVLAELLAGSGYDFLLVGDQGKGTPREIMLSTHHAGAVGNQANSGNFNRPIQQDPSDEDVTQDNNEEPSPPQNMRPAMAQPVNQPPGGFRNPQQQRIYDMQQQRMQQMLQQQQQQQNQQQNPQ